MVELMMDQFSKLLNQEAVKSVDAPLEIEISPHAHALVLMDDKIQTFSTREDSDAKMLCNGCIQPILAANRFYGCVQCEFFVHEFCANLPTEWKHPSHPEHLLKFKCHTNIFDYQKCSACDMFCNGFIYECDDQCCNFMIDIRCSLLPNRVKHVDHRHPLVQSEVVSPYRCLACGLDLSIGQGMEFGCQGEFCFLHLHQKCALLPASIKHRLDRQHCIPLMYPPFMDYLDVVYCENCEEEIDTNYCLYHCRECDMSFHTQCIDRAHNIKFGGKIKVDIHRHPLTFVQNKTQHSRSLCDRCGVELTHQQPVLECAQCEFLLCTTCARHCSSVATVPSRLR